MGRGFEPHRAHLRRKARTFIALFSLLEVRAFLMRDQGARANFQPMFMGGTLHERHAYYTRIRASIRSPHPQVRMGTS